VKREHYGKGTEEEGREGGVFSRRQTLYDDYVLNDLVIIVGGIDCMASWRYLAGDTREGMNR
jgi:hypothetical protein